MTSLSQNGHENTDLLGPVLAGLKIARPGTSRAGAFLVRRLADHAGVVTIVDLSYGATRGIVADARIVIEDLGRGTRLPDESELGLGSQVKNLVASGAVHLHRDLFSDVGTAS